MSEENYSYHFTAENAFTSLYSKDYSNIGILGPTSLPTGAKRELESNEILFWVHVDSTDQQNLKRQVAAVDGAFKEFFGTRTLTPPGIITSREPKKHTNEIAAVIIKLDQPLAELPELSYDDKQTIYDLAKRNYQLLSQWSNRFASLTGKQLPEELQYSTNPSEIHWDRESVLQVQQTDSARARINKASESDLESTVAAR